MAGHWSRSDDAGTEALGVAVERELGSSGSDGSGPERPDREARGFGLGLRTEYRPAALVVGIVVFLIAWEAIAQVIAHTATHPERVFPTLEYIVKVATPQLSNYWDGGFGIAAPEQGGSSTYGIALLAVLSNGVATLLRVALGLGLAIAGGVGLGLAVGWSQSLRLVILGPANFLRMMPLLAMVPLFTLWFGATLKGVVFFIGFAVGTVLLVATINAIENVPIRYQEYAATLGASRFRIYRSVVAPAILPELRSGMFVALGFAWSVALAAEFLGVQTGLGRMMELALRFSQVGRMVVIAVIFILLAIASFRLLDRIANRLTRWAE